MPASIAQVETNFAQEREREANRKLMNEKAKKFACPHKNCEKHGKVGDGNIVFVRKYGKQPSQNLFKCNQCKKTFSERKGTPLFNVNLPEETIFQIIRCLLEGNGTRATARICGVHRDTVTTIIRRFGDHSKQISHEFLQNYPLKECQLDEMWAFIKKNKKTSRPSNTWKAN